MSRKKTHQEFIKEMQIKHPNLTILSEYYNAHTRIKYKCNKCGLVWNATASKLSLGRGCPQCAGNKLKSHNEFITQVKKINPNIDVTSQYVSTSRKVSFKCKVCGYEWLTRPGSILRGKGCYWCGKKNMGQKRTKSPEIFKQEIKKINPNIQLGEIEIKNILKLYNITFISQYKVKKLLGVRGRYLSYDFYLPEYNLLIEYQGKQHKQPIKYFGGEEMFKKQKEHDRRKREYAFRHNIKLLEIWYYENIEDKLKKNLNLETVTTTGC
jgi:hypothetical protein|nr:MAG TPA: restriction enzyme [Caudoviricetes sp.]